MSEQPKCNATLFRISGTVQCDRIAEHRGRHESVTEQGELGATWRDTTPGAKPPGDDTPAQAGPCKSPSQMKR